MFLLYELYRSDQPSANPFIQFFIELLQPQVEDDRTVAGLACGHALSATEKWFLGQLLNTATPKDVCVGGGRGGGMRRRKGVWREGGRRREG